LRGKGGSWGGKEGRERGGVRVREGAGGKRGEMTQTLYAHMNIIKKGKKRSNKREE
jgi:hypothetical protein